MNLRIRALSIHAAYQCGHSGACCTAGWPIPVERATSLQLNAALGEGRLRLEGDREDAAGETTPEVISRGGAARTESLPGRPLLVVTPDAPDDTPVVAASNEHGACVFYERGRRRCAIHRQLGETLLPDTCRQFPRVSLLDGRGLSVTLSHFCPTAAALLFAGSPARVVSNPPAFPSAFPFDPLDARHALPPLLHPGVLLELDTFDAWERTVVAFLGRRGNTPDQALAGVTDLTEALRRWEPGRRDARTVLADATRAATARAADAAAEPSVSAERLASHHALVLRAVPGAFRPQPIEAERVMAADARFVAATWPSWSPPVRRFLAAKLFGNWLAYQGRGLRTMVFSAWVALSLVRAHAALECGRRAHPLDRDALAAAFRRTDELLLHLASRQALADQLSVVERSLAAPGRLGVPFLL